MKRKALVLFSGGQDSTTCLAWALNRYEHVETIGFDYRQRHSIELTCRGSILNSLKLLSPSWSKKLGDDHMLDLGVLGLISDTALTQSRIIDFSDSGLPNTFVPGRNLLFFTFAAAVAYRRGLDVLVGGMCETDYSGYPDCRDNTLKALQVSLSLGIDAPMLIETPLMWLDKPTSIHFPFATQVSTLASDSHKSNQCLSVGEAYRSFQLRFRILQHANF